MAGDSVTGRRFMKGRDHGLAERLGQRTARMERATRGRMNRGRHVARQEEALPPGLRVHHGNRREERLGVRMPGRVDDGFGIRQLDDLPEIHYHYTAADVFHDGQVVRDEQVRDAAFLLQILQEVDDLPTR